MRIRRRRQAPVPTSLPPTLTDQPEGVALTTTRISVSARSRLNLANPIKYPREDADIFSRRKGPAAPADQRWVTQDQFSGAAETSWTAPSRPEGRTWMRLRSCG